MYDHISYFDYELPEHLIAQYPLFERISSRLLCLNVKAKAVSHASFLDVLDLFQENDILIVNDTKVFPARLYGRKETGGEIECLVERVLFEKRALVHLKSSKSPKHGALLFFENDLSAKVLGRQDDLFLLEFYCDDLFSALETYGHIPLPPYIERQDVIEDKFRYQTVYAKHRGAVAAPTAGLHFTIDLLNQLQKKGINVMPITLHVGAGTFQPLRVEHIETHKIHSEYLEVGSEVCEAIVTCRQKGGRVIAVGTTTLRALETAAQSGQLLPFKGDTDLFIRPGYSFQCVDVLITNFHLPKSTLLMLVAAFGGYDLVMQAYKAAIEHKYRFYSYGDAMLIER